MRLPTRTLEILFIACIVPLSVACAPSPKGRTERLVGTIPADRFQFAGDSLDEVFRWELGEGNSLAPWTIRADRTIEQRDEFLILAGSDRAQIVREVDFDAGDVDRILVRQDGLRNGRTRVYWAREGEEFSAERNVSLRERDAIDGVYEFGVSEHPQWSGRIRRFRFDATNAGNERVQVASIVGARTRTDLPNTVHGRSWGFEFDQQLRSGALVTETLPQDRTVSTDGSTRLHFATHIVLSPDAGPARFTVSRLDSGEPRELWDHTVLPGEAAPGWVPATLVLDGSGEIPLRFAIECPDSEKCAGTFASIETRSGGASQRPNLLLISIDTLRSDRMSLYGNESPTTPNIDRWAAGSGVTFERVIAASPWTLPSHVSMFTGQDPTTHNVNFNTPIPEEIELLSERLHQDGYFTAAVTGGGFVSPEFGFWQGFDVYTYWQRAVDRYWRDQTASGTELPSGMERARELLDELDGRPFFLFLHTYEVHAPFHVRLPYFEDFFGRLPDDRGAVVSTRPFPQTAQNGYKLYRSLSLSMSDGGVRRMSADEVPLALAMYDSGIAFTDAHVGELFEDLEERGLLHNTIIVLTSDHGEMLGEMGLAGHAYVHEENVRIPLVISWPAGFEGGSRIDGQVRTIDIAPTVLELLGKPVPEWADGVSLVRYIEGRGDGRPRRALTYAASSNHGLAVRLPNDLTYLYDNSLFRPGRVDNLAPSDRDSSAVGVDYSDRADELNREVEQMLESREGLHMALINDETSGEFTARLRGAPIRREKLKATRITCPCAAWLGTGSTVELRVPGGLDYGVQIEDARAGTLFIEIRDGGDTFSTEVVLSDLHAPVAVTPTAEGWTQTPLTDAEVDRGLVVWWTGGIGTGGDATLDEDMTRRLRALGYLR